MNIKNELGEAGRGLSHPLLPEHPAQSLVEADVHELNESEQGKHEWRVPLGRYFSLYGACAPGVTVSFIVGALRAPLRDRPMRSGAGACLWHPPCNCPEAPWPEAGQP